ncbi:MAG: hypothetical protein WD512_01945 [Candidatus Paceibacterota bacterium]
MEDTNIIHPCLQQIIEQIIKQKPTINITKVWMPSDSWVIIQVKSTHPESTHLDNQLYVINYYHRKYHPEALNRRIKRCNLRYIPDYTKLSENQPIFRQMDTFQQNDIILGKQVRQTIKEIMYKMMINPLLSSYNFIGIGGEFYLYFILYKHLFRSYHGYSNNHDIIQVAEHNLKYHLNFTQYSLTEMDYNSKSRPGFLEKLMDKYNFVLVNLSTVPINLLKNLLQLKPQELLIITCNQKQFTNRRVCLEQVYKLQSFSHHNSDKYHTAIISIYHYRLRR